MKHHNLCRGLPFGVLFFLLGLSLVAQIPIGGAQFGTLGPGVYHTNANLSVAVGQTWTLQAGVIIKFTSSGHSLAVDGTLITNGALGNPVIFTDDADDSAGGDTNMNGPSNGAPTAWQGIVFTGAGSNASVLTRADIRYGGGSFVSNLELTNSNATFINCTIRNCFTHGADLNSNSRPIISNCTFQNNGGTAIANAPFDGVALITNNTATGNALNSIHVSTANLTSNLTVTSASNLTGGIIVDSNIVVNPAITLSLNAGVVLKFSNNGASLDVNGTGVLNINGTPSNPVVLTDDGDDSVGGDTNSNGASAGAATAWQGIELTGGSGSVLQHADIRFGGGSFVSNLELNSSNATIINCTIRNCFTHGMDLNQTSLPTVTNCTFQNNGGTAIFNAPFNAVSGITNNTATGNGLNSIHVSTANLTSNLTVTSASNLTGGIIVNSNIVVNPGVTLSLNAGVVLKFSNNGASLSVNGTGVLNANGTPSNPVVLTDDADDTAGGDTNSNGLSAGAPTAWQGIVLTGGNGSVLQHADIRFGGGAFVSNLELNNSSATINNCTIRNCFTDAIDLNGSSLPTIRNCSIVNNGGTAINNAPIRALEGFFYNTATGNGVNSVRVTQGVVSTSVSIGAQAMLGGAVISNANFDVQATGILELGPGVIVKFESTGNFIQVSGAVNFRGTSYEPVVLTDDSDDAFGGDTNSNGPSAGGPTSWQGMTIAAAAGTSLLENVRIRFTGGAFVPALTCNSPVALLKAVRADSAFDRGLVLSAMAMGSANLVAHACGNHGIQLAGGSVDLVHATVSNCPTGIRREAAYTGNVRNSISSGNTTNFSNFGTGTSVFNSCGGFAGTNGNINVSPLFVNQAAGDLHLQAGSPCINSADLAVALPVAKDHDENSRGLDAALVGLPFPDMGAFEFGLWDMTVTGQPRPGFGLNFTVTGPPGDSIYYFGILDGSIALTPFGVLNAGAIPFVTVIPITGFLPVGSTYTISIPNDPAIVGFSAGIQTVTVPTASPALGHFTRLYRGTVRP